MPVQLREWFMISNGFNYPTAKKLAKKLGINLGKHPKFSRKKIIRWGYSKKLPTRNIETTTFPNQDAIKFCANKLKTFQILKEKNVSVPEFYTTEVQLRNVTYPLYSRKKYHTMGKDIIMINSIEEAKRNLAQNRYLVKSIPCKKEYRIHVFNNEIISASKKYLREELWEELGSPIMKDIIRNNENGWGYYDIQNLDNVPQRVKEEALKSVRALSLIWGAVDLIRTPRNEVYVLEVNSAPGLRNGRIDLYVEKFKELMENPNQFIQR